MKYNKRWGLISLFPILLLFFASCDVGENTVGTLNEVLTRVPDVQLIDAGDNATINVEYDKEYSYFTVSLSEIGHLGAVSEGLYHAWCVQLDNHISTGQAHKGTRLYTTSNDRIYNQLSYIINNRDFYENTITDLTWKDIQVAFWVILETLNYNLDAIKGRLPEDVEGFNPSAVQSILKDVQSKGKFFKPGLGHKKIIKANVSGDEQDIIIETKDESAWGYGGIAVSECFSEIDGLSSNNWGWSNGPFGAGEYTLDLWAGAGQCDLAKGTLVGKVEINYDNGTLSAKFLMTEISDWTGKLFTMLESHLYVGNERLPKLPNGKFTTAPGQYGHENSHENATEYTYSISGLSGNVYVVAHAVVDGFQPD